MTTKGWEVCVQWKHGSSTWNSIKDLKDSYPIELSEYAAENRLASKPIFSWWVLHTPHKREQIISKIRSKYWEKPHKYGIQLPKGIQEYRRLDQENQNNFWIYALADEMKTPRPALEVFEGAERDLPIGYQKIGCHVIWDVNLGENFRR